MEGLPHLLAVSAHCHIMHSHTLIHSFFFFFFFKTSSPSSLLDHILQHVELPQPGIKPVPPAVEAWSLKHWATKEVCFIFSHLFILESWALSRFGERGESRVRLTQSSALQGLLVQADFVRT